MTRAEELADVVNEVARINAGVDRVMRRLRKAEADAEALASAGSKMVLACQVSAPGEAQFDGSYHQLREALARYRGEK